MFKELKELLITILILAHFDPKKEALVEADLSGYITRGLLSAWHLSSYGIL